MADQLYATLDATGRPTAFYRDSVHSTIPESAIKITPAQWHEFRDNPGRRIIADPTTWDGTTLEVVQPPQPTRLERRAALKAERDRLLAATDFISIRHAEELEIIAAGDPTASTTLDDQALRRWQRWRRDLRELAISVAEPASITFPNPPGPIVRVSEV